MRSFNSIIAVSAALFLSSCFSAPKNDPAAIVAQLKASEAKWNRAYADHDAVALAAAYAPDAALANPGAALVTGADAIRKETASFASDPNLKVAFASDRIQVARSGDLAYTRGHYTLTMSDPATKKPVDSGGNYLTVWQKQADGSWKAVEDFAARPGRHEPGHASPSPTTSRSSTTATGCIPASATAPRSKHSPSSTQQHPLHDQLTEELSKILDTAHCGVVHVAVFELDLASRLRSGRAKPQGCY